MERTRKTTVSHRGLGRFFRKGISFVETGHILKGIKCFLGLLFFFIRITEDSSLIGSELSLFRALDSRIFGILLHAKWKRRSKKKYWSSYAKLAVFFIFSLTEAVISSIAVRKNGKVKNESGGYSDIEYFSENGIYFC